LECPNCGTKLNGETNCPKCGVPISYQAQPNGSSTEKKIKAIGDGCMGIGCGLPILIVVACIIIFGIIALFQN
jgi:uncharacterized membrane protein YvbJ